MTSFLIVILATMPAAALAWLLGAGVERQLPARGGVVVWRVARLAAASPVLAGVAVWLVAQWPADFTQGAAAEGAGTALAPALVAFDLAPVATAISDTASAAPDWAAPAFLMLYLSGLALALARMTARRRELQRLLAASRPAGPGLEGLADHWRGRLALDRQACQVRVVDADLSPFVAGLHPVIIAPATLEGAPAANFAMAHELMHVRRGDERDRLLGEALVALFWFNPFTRAIERRLAGAREMACDADVMDRLGRSTARDYAAAIAACAPPAPASGFLSELRDLRRRRVEAVLHPPRGSRRAATLAAAAGLSVMAGGSGVAMTLAVASGAGQDEQAVRQVSPRELSEPIGAAVMEIQAMMDAEDHDAMLARTGALLETDLTAYERSVVLRLEAAALFELDRYADSVGRFEAAIETGALSAEDEAAAYFNALQLHMVLGDYDRGADYADRYLAYDPAPDTRRKITLAQVYVQSGRVQAALPLAEAAIAEMDAPASNQLALLEFIYQELGREADRARIRARREAMEEE